MALELNCAEVNYKPWVNILSRVVQLMTSDPVLSCHHVEGTETAVEALIEEIAVAADVALLLAEALPQVKAPEVTVGLSFVIAPLSPFIQAS